MENGVILNLTLVDCPGFGDAVDNSKWLVISSFCCFSFRTIFDVYTKK